MDQDSSNGAGPDKRNWRERLGIGAKELPKLSDEFRDAPQFSAPPAEGTAKPAPRAPVTKPAPMAPRVKPAQPAADAPSAAAPSVPPALSRATPRAPDNAAQDALAEKLRAQRAAAERLAEQRVQAARNRAEGKKPEAPVPQRPAAPPLRPTAGAPRTPGLPPAPGAPRPKFSFADDRGEPRPGGAAPLTPPRPALGGDRSPPPFLRPSANGSLGARPQPAFRPTITEGGSGYVPPPRLPGVTRPGLGADPAGYGGSRLPVRRTPPLDPYARQPEPRETGEDEFDEDVRAAPRLGRPVGLGREDDLDDVFEDDAAPRGRATARDYQSEYNEGEEGFADEPRRSSGPWLLLLALLAAAVLVGGLVWYYSDNMKNLAGVGSSSSSGTTPVVPAPADPAKVAAPDAGGDSQNEAPAARKKQIYDRIVGEQEVTGEMQPTEETPVAPEAAQPDAGQPAATEAQPVEQVPKVEPSGSANPIPVPDAPTQGTTGGGLPEVEPPAPLPIPGADGQQGNLGLKGGSQVAATSAQPDQGGAAPPPLPSSSTQTSSSDANTPPPPEKATDGAALVSGAASTASSGAGSAAATEPVITSPAPATPAQTQAAVDETTPPPPKKKAPAKKAAAKQAASKQPDYNNLGAKPVVLVPPSQQGAASDQSTAAAAQPPAADAPPAATVPNTQKRKTIFDLFNGGTSTNIPSEPPAPAQVASAATQTQQATAPATQQKAAPAPAQPQASTGGGYVVQLASFRTDMEAKQEYSRLAGAYPGVVGSLKSQIRQTNVGGSPRYQLGLGPLPTRGDATRVCGELIAAGESDCIVRGQ